MLENSFTEIIFALLKSLNKQTQSTGERLSDDYMLQV